MKLLSPFAAGVLFAVGLAVSGMTSPSNVIAFLDVAGAWDPSLALVMLGAVGVFATAHAWSRRRMQRPLAAPAFAAPTAARIDRRLLVGSALFGVGWGLAGYCPGPALVASAAGGTEALAFSCAMIAGLWVTRKLDERVERGAA